LVEHRHDLLNAHDAVVVVDVGSRLDQAFFSHVDWTTESAAVQAWLRGSESGVGGAASLSESAAQNWQDRGREAFGWTVQLRSTGMVLAPGLLCGLAPRLWTSVEDTEATLLLAADRVPVVLAGDQAIVYDTKPSAITDAAMQRSRWLFGKISLFYHQPAALLKLCLRSPAEGLAFLCELLSRPYTLTGLFRAALTAAFAADSILGGGGILSFAFAVVLALSLVSDAVMYLGATGIPARRLALVAMGFAASWVGAIVLLPRAIVGWARARRR
jgi:hypothetical protein